MKDQHKDHHIISDDNSQQHKINVLVIEDEYDICDALVSYLNLENFSAYGVSCTKEATQWLVKNPVDMIILDVGLPDQNGIEWLTETKASHHIGIIMATARTALADRLQALNAGADAYLVKPIEYQELLLLIGNIYNRIHANKVSDSLKPQTPTWIINSQWELISPSGEAIELTKSEFILLKQLALQKGTSVKKNDIIIALGHSIESYDYRRMETLVRRLRNKVKTELDITIPIKTIHAVGYSFTEEILCC